MTNLKVLFVASELTPIAKVGGLGDVAGALPKYLKEDVDISVVIPAYQAIKEKVEYIPNSKVKIHYIDIPEYFSKRDKIYGYTDDPVRYAHFDVEVVNKIKDGAFGKVDIVHINDYHTSWIPILIKDRNIDGIKTILTIHNLGSTYQGRYSLDLLDHLNLSQIHPSVEEDKKDGEINPLLQGILNASIISTVSPTYAKEILEKEYGGDLDYFLNQRKDDIYGILNGIDTTIFDPKTDPNIYVNYDLSDYKEKKATNKIRLIEELNLKFSSSQPLYSFIARLDAQKGVSILTESIMLTEITLLTKSLQNVRQDSINFLFLGTGDEKIASKIKEIEASTNDVKLEFTFDPVLAEKIYAASDVLIIPSKYEPCGLTQMIAMRYGTLPIVRETGGLKDSVEDQINGFVFKEFDEVELKDVILESFKIFGTSKWDEMVKNAMRKDFSWDKSSKEYVKLYKKMTGIL